MSNKNLIKNSTNNSSKESINDSDKDWVNYTVNLNDGWADDVSLAYPEDSWKPDEEELTIVNISDSNNDDSINIFSKNNNSKNNDLSQTSDVKFHKESKFHFIFFNKFSLFMIIWCFLLIIFISILLISFYDKLQRYQYAYEESVPDNYMSKFMLNFSENNTDNIYSSLTVLPAINEFESEDDVKIYLRNMLANNISDNIFSFKRTDNYTDFQAEYKLFMESDEIGTISLLNSPKSDSESDFPNWYISYFDLQITPENNITIYAQKDLSISINSISLSDSYLCSDEDINVFYIPDFYLRPNISAYDSYGNSVSVLYNATKDIYEINN